jgi:hypothetical protein
MTPGIVTRKDAFKRQHLLSGPLTSRSLGSRANIHAVRLHGKRSASRQAQQPAGQLLRVWLGSTP